MPGPKRGFTTPHTCAKVDSAAGNQPLERDRKAHEKLQEKVSDFQVTFDDNVYLSIGLEAKCDNYHFFDPSKDFDIHLETPLHDHPPLVKIKQKGKPSVLLQISTLPINCLLILQSDPKAQIITIPMLIRQKQRTPHSLKQTHFSQVKYAFTCGCYTHNKHPC